MSDPIQSAPKKRFTKFKLGLYLLALIGLGWLAMYLWQFLGRGAPHS